jgi:ATP-dependent DNA helicase RecG
VVIGEMSRTELMAKLSLKDRVNFTEKYLEPALLLALLEMTQASSPNSPTQKYRLTELGRQTLENLTRYK